MMGRSPGGTALCSPQFIRGRLGGDSEGFNGGVVRNRSWGGLYQRDGSLVSWPTRE
jgi:hypothetical protein